MDGTEIPIPDAKMAEYRRTARRRWEAEKEQRALRYDQGLGPGPPGGGAAAPRLRYHARRRVWLAAGPPAADTLRSDVDLAAWGLTAQNWLRAIGAVRALRMTSSLA
ncbi:MAG: hypothetical protein KIS91_05805 [Anaerolineae bacterium]|nr:hypothetical protein [Anaerolineae bacterium]